MWMDINTNPKQGTVFWVFGGRVMGIPVDYDDNSFAAWCNFRPPNWEPELVSMLPIPNEQAEECVGNKAKVISAYLIIRVFTLVFVLSVCIHFQIAVVILYYLPFYLHLVAIHCF